MRLLHLPARSSLRPLAVVLALCLAPLAMPQLAAEDTIPPQYALVIHGGAGIITRENMDTEKEQQYRAKLREALEVGEQVLAGGGSSLDAVEKVINLMEDSPLFNAGKGAVFTAEGKNELDASIMNGRDLNAGAVAGVSTIKNPISAARAVMEDSPHVMLAREGAERFAAEHGIETVEPEYFFTEGRWKALQRAKERAKEKASEKADEKSDKHGTVGCVALDRDGNIAAGTSTGGMTNKLWGRVGDSPVIGAGTYANNQTCGVSATGHGEYFIRHVVAYQIAAQMEYAGLSLVEAAERVINGKLSQQAGSGGIVALDHAGNVAMVFNSPGMYRGFLKSTGESGVFIYGDE